AASRAGRRRSSVAGGPAEELGLADAMSDACTSLASATDVSDAVVGRGGLAVPHNRPSAVSPEIRRRPTGMARAFV
ncbi:MAG: hypothetical protein OEW19_20180, partial [Acidobacteriota bacterium]|nr:hypothetical protein [Acidobacteriota bacterium]